MGQPGSGPACGVPSDEGDPEALEDLRELLDGDWQIETSDFPDGRRIRVGFLSRLELAEVEQVPEFPEHLAPVQVTTRAPRWRRSAAAPCGRG